jgi:hypothetical protein
LADPAAKLTESYDRGLNSRQLGIVALAAEHPLHLPAPSVTLIHRHPALIADLLPNGKREKKDGAIWITYEPPERRPSRCATKFHAPTGPNGAETGTVSRLPEQ